MPNNEVLSPKTHSEPLMYIVYYMKVEILSVAITVLISLYQQKTILRGLLTTMHVLTRVVLAGHHHHSFKRFLKDF